MNTKVMVSTLVISLVMLAGCSTVPNTSQVADSHVESDFNHDKIQKIDRTNRSRGIDTVWINPPRKNDKDSDGSH